MAIGNKGFVPLSVFGFNINIFPPDIILNFNFCLTIVLIDGPLTRYKIFISIMSVGCVLRATVFLPQLDPNCWTSSLLVCHLQMPADPIGDAFSLK